MSVRVVVIGAGPGGYSAALRAAQLGADVTLIEKGDIGGTCLNEGCIPSKIMWTAAEMLAKIRKGADWGLIIKGSVETDMQSLMARKEKIIDNQRTGLEKLFAKHHICLIRGEAFIDRSGSLVVQTGGQEQLEICWDRLILAPGSKPLGLPGLPFDGKHILSSSDVLKLTKIPETILIVGGGVIGCEFASVFAAFGAAVTIVESMERILPLPSVEETSSRLLQREMKKRRIRLLLSTRVLKMEKTPKGLSVTLKPQTSSLKSNSTGEQSSTLLVDSAFVCIGRTAVTGSLGLENLGVACDVSGWIAVDKYLETSVANVFAVGDVLGPAKPMLAHVAIREGIVAAENALGAKREMDYCVVPGIVFSIPEVASAGLTFAAAEESGYSVQADTILFRTLGKAQAMGEIEGEIKIVWDGKTGKILGAHLVGPHATELIAEAGLAIRKGCTVNDLAQTIHAHPTLAEGIMEASCSASRKALHA